MGYKTKACRDLAALGRCSLPFVCPYHRDIRQSVKKYDRYAAAEHCGYKLCQPGKQHFSSKSKHSCCLHCSPQQRSTYPEDSQKHFSNSEPFFYSPGIPKRACRITPQQLSQEGKGATETPPYCWSGAEGPAYQERNMPPSIDTQKNCNAWMRGARLCGL